MYRTVLAAITGQLNSEVSARYALRVAQQARARILFCAVTRHDLSEREFQATEETIKRLSRLAREMNVQADVLIATGDPVEQIRRFAASESVDIVFAATRHEDVRKHFYARVRPRTVARKLLLHLDCAVALVRVVHLGRMLPKTILVPLKGRIAHIPEQAQFASLLAAACGAQISVFHAARPMTQFFHGETQLTPAEWEKRRPHDISRYITCLKRHSVDPEKRFVAGNPAEAITIEAASRKHDLIIMGASERHLLRSIFRGSPVERVLRETTCDLIILKPSGV